jgi:mannose-6-phosphate isomerase-like protein (cupin superfamily)
VDAARGYAVAADDGERLTFAGGTVLIKAATTALTVWEELPPLLDTPLHVHEHEDEMFQILEGEHVFQCGDDEFEVGPGASSPSPAMCHMLTGAWCPKLDGFSS